MELTVIKLVFQALPESIALISLSFAIIGLKLELKNVLMVGITQTIAAYLVRLANLTFGVHTVILIVILATLLNLIMKVKLSRSMLSALLSIVLLAVSETVLVLILLQVTGFQIEQVTQNTVIWILFGWPHIIFLFILAMLINIWRKKRKLRNEKTNG